MYQHNLAESRWLHAWFGPLLACISCVATIGNGTPAASQQEWPYAPIRLPQVPNVDQDEWSLQPVDRFILKRLRDHKLQPAPDASRSTWMRRVYFDLLGVPPEPAEVECFVQDQRDDAAERLVDRLLADPRYGERWGRRWLDLARYADTAGYEGDPDLPHAWRYRDYVIDSWNRDKPFNQFVLEQLAGDECEPVMGAGDLPEVPAENLVALTFLRLAPFTEPRGDASRHELLSEMTSTVGSVFLGLTLGCAKCHDHKYDDIPTEDFYRLQAFFSTVQIPRPERGDPYQIGGSLEAPFYREGEAQWAEEERGLLQRTVTDAAEELPRLRKQLAQQLQVPEANIDALVEARDARVPEPDQERFAYLQSRTRFVAQQMLRLQPVAMSLRHSYGPPYEPGVPVTRVMIRGEYDQPGPEVEPGFPRAIVGNVESASIRLDPFQRWPTRSRRLALAEWLVNRDNPLTARVMANRLWAWHFGEGIVPTPSDFGQLSGGPSHPELLDWLAHSLQDRHWSLKDLHRRMVTSRTYRQSSTVTNRQAAQVDPGNRWLWHFARRRLEGEAIRDSVLAVSGRLNHERFGLPIWPPLPESLEQVVRYGDSKWDTQLGHAGRKRSVYIYQQRTLTMPLMQVFDALVCDESQPLRRASITPLQALAMFNSDFANHEAVAFADRVMREAAATPQDAITFAFTVALGRPPLPQEREPLLALYHSSQSPQAGMQRVCRVLFNCNEFIYID